MCFSNIGSIEGIMVGYRYYRIFQSIETIELVSLLLPSLLSGPHLLLLHFSLRSGFLTWYPMLQF